MDPADTERVKQELMKKRNWTWDQADLFYTTNPTYFTSRVKRTVPSPPELLEAFEGVRAAFAECKDGETKKTFFNKETHESWTKLMKHVELGCLSDKPGVDMYGNFGMLGPVSEALLAFVLVDCGLNCVGHRCTSLDGAHRCTV